MTGAAIVRWQSGDAVVLAVHGAFDGASAWALRLAMEESEAARYVVDLTHAVEACEFAASILATFVQQSRRMKRVAFLPGDEGHARLLAGFGLELIEDEVDAGVPLLRPSWPSAETDLEPARPPGASSR
jgi:anti-anti-sigma regulatory factor